ncbi:MAG: hypothetical protein ACREO3_01890 [Arenimonas sp.]
MSNEIRFAGPVAADAAHGLHGGTCVLSLAGGVFVLQLARHYAYGIDDTDTVRGACAAAPTGYLLEARAWRSCSHETTAVEAERSLAARWNARFADTPAPREAAVELRFGLGADFLDLLLLRQPARGTSPDPALESWFAAECTRREADLEAERERQFAAREHMRRSTESTPAFAAGDYARVEDLLGPIETSLSPSERQRLALARRHLGSPGQARG